jgi:hypothetical protein
MMGSKADYRELMRRFAPQTKKRAVAAASPAAVVVSKKRKAVVALRRPTNGVAFPIEVWAKIIQWLPNVSFLMPLSMLNKSLRAAIW